jgi:hypothetical protein
MPPSSDFNSACFFENLYTTDFTFSYAVALVPKEMQETCDAKAAQPPVFPGLHCRPIDR